MLSVQTERQADEIALVGVIPQAGIRKISDLVRVEIQDRNRLVSHCFLSAITVIEQCRVVSIGAEDHCGRKAVGTPNSARRWDRESLARRELDGRAFVLRGLRLMSRGADQPENNKRTRREMNHKASADDVQDNARRRWKKSSLQSLGLRKSQRHG